MTGWCLAGLCKSELISRGTRPAEQFDVKWLRSKERGRMCWPRSIEPTSVRAQAVPRHVGVILDGNHRHGRQRHLTDPEEVYAVGRQAR